MKKFLSAILSALFILSLVACGEAETKSPEGSTAAQSQSESATEETKEAGSGVFRVGFAMENITPDDPVPLSGYGNSDKRMSEGYLDYIYTTCIAITDENDNTLLFFTTDLVISNDSITKEIRKNITEQYGIPGDQILLSATHTHSSVDVGYDYLAVVHNFVEDFKAKAVKAAGEALADRSASTMKWGTADLTGYNFVRHYITTEGDSVGDNHGDYARGTVDHHATEANHIMYLVEFDREDGKAPVLMANWRVHDHVTGGGSKHDLSADVSGMMRTYLQKDEGILFAYYNGDCGNINPVTRLKEEGVDGVTIQINDPRNYKKYARGCVDIIEKSLKENMVEAKTGTVEVHKETFSGNVNHTQDYLLPQAQEISTYWKESNDRTGCVERGHEYGIESPYHANAIVNRNSMAATREIEVYYGHIGEIGFVEVPNECFDTNGDWLRANSPYEKQLFMGYANSHQGYMPSQYGYEYGCYEADISYFEPGTAETLMKFFVDKLNAMNK